MAFALTNYDDLDNSSEMLENEKQATLQFYLYSWGSETDETKK